MKDAMPGLAATTRAVLEDDAAAKRIEVLAAAVVDAAIAWVRDCDAVSIGSDAEIFAQARRVLDLDAHENAAGLLTTAVRAYERERAR